MRWYYVDPQNPSEIAARNAVVARIDAWWQAFLAKSGDCARLFRRESEWDLPGWMGATLQAIHPQLMWEYGPAIRQAGHRLVITPEGNRQLRPIGKTILERAPQMSGWEFYDYRLPEPAEQIEQHVMARTQLRAGGAVAEAAVGQGRKVDLTFYFPQATNHSDDQRRHAAFVAVETLLGEQILDQWIGRIDAVADPRELRGRPLGLARLQETVRAVIHSLWEQLPSVPCHQIPDFHAKSHNAQLQPTPSATGDYPRRDDLIALSTMRLEVLDPICRNLIFSSPCHSRCNEWYTYLKIDAAQVPTQQRVEFRSRFEDLLDPALRQAGIGCSIGGGSGIRYGYVDLALTDVGRAVEIMRQLLPTAGIPMRSWLLFHDDELADEWVGIYPQTPPPPSVQ